MLRALARIGGQHRHHGYYGMMHNHRREINVKRTWRVYHEDGLAERKRRREKLPALECQQLVSASFATPKNIAPLEPASLNQDTCSDSRSSAWCTQSTTAPVV